MFGSLGFPEIAFILILALLLFGPRRLPEIGRTVGKSLAEFRKASNDLRRTLENEVALDDPEKKPRAPAIRPDGAPPVPRGAAELAAPKEAPAEAAAEPVEDGPVKEPTAGAPDTTPEAPIERAPAAGPESERSGASRAD